jgi:hypothetical protein
MISNCGRHPANPTNILKANQGEQPSKNLMASDNSPFRQYVNADGLGEAGKMNSRKGNSAHPVKHDDDIEQAIFDL